jgi:hypothetical protein
MKIAKMKYEIYQKNNSIIKWHNENNGESESNGRRNGES